MARSRPTRIGPARIGPARIGSPRRIAINLAFDGLAALAAGALALWITRPAPLPYGLVPLAALTLLAGGLPFGLPAQYWRFAGFDDLVCLVKSAALAVLLAWLIAPALGWPVGPRFAACLWLAYLAALGTPRVLYRLGQRQRRAGEAAATALLVGTSESADLFLRALAQKPGLRIAGLLTLNERHVGRRIQGVPILGTDAALPDVVQRLGADAPSLLIVTGLDVTGGKLASLLDAAAEQGMEVKRAPAPTELGPATPGRAVELKPVVIEDLLNRPQVQIDREGMARLMEGRRVLVTGAGGTIGSELVRQVADLAPAELLLLDNGEYSLWKIDIELGAGNPATRRRTVIADIRDAARIRTIFEAFRPQIVFHAAALKHVPLVEANPLEGLLTNAVGSRHVADAARAVGAEAMVLISTDKAVNPTSVMGASKRVAEMYCQGLDRAARRDGGMRCITVRFGNVLGSTGSVVPLFRRQLAAGGPLTVTHPDMQRYFMTVREAVSLVLQASVIGHATSHREGGPALADGGIFVLEMGAPVKIVDLARQMIRLAGLRPDIDIGIQFSGLRPGEKLHEELFHGREPPVATDHPGLLIATPRAADAATVGEAIDAIEQAARDGDTGLGLARLARLVPEFEPAADGG